MKRLSVAVLVLSLLCSTSFSVAGLFTGQRVSAAITKTIYLPQKEGYTKANLVKEYYGRISRPQKRRLISASIVGMTKNHFQDTDPEDQCVINLSHLSTQQRKSLAEYTLLLINSARRQIGRKPWRYSKRAMNFAQLVGRNYNQDHMSCWSKDHDVPGILRAAKKEGLDSHEGQVYEDEAGFYRTKGQSMTLKMLKENLFFNLKQMLFGGYSSGSDTSPQAVYDANNYTEWHHACDLLGVRKSFDDNSRKYFGLSISTLDGMHYSVHVVSYDKDLIVNGKHNGHRGPRLQNS